MSEIRDAQQVYDEQVAGFRDAVAAALAVAPGRGPAIVVAGDPRPYGEQEITPEAGRKGPWHEVGKG